MNRSPVIQSPPRTPTSTLHNSPIYKKKKIIPKSPIATARRLNLNPAAALTDRPVAAAKVSPPVVSSPTKRFVGHTLRHLPTTESVRWLKRLLDLAPHNTKKKSLRLLNSCQPCCVVLTKLPLEANQQSMDITKCSRLLKQVLTDCSYICRSDYGYVHGPWMITLQRRMKRIYAALLLGKTPRIVSIRVEPLVKSPKPPKSQPRRGPPIPSSTPGKTRFFLLELKRKTILIPVVGNQMGQRAFELDNPKNIGILYNIAASLQKSSDDLD